jgi:hypothetical protein
MAATKLVVTGLPSPTEAGSVVTLTITTEDASSNTVTGYTGSVHFTSTDPRAVLPLNYTFTSADRGSHTFATALKTVGTQSISVTDTAASGITGTQGGIIVIPAKPTHLGITLKRTGTATATFGLIVTALDTYTNTVTGYLGTIHFASTGKGLLPAHYTFTGADQGVHVFTVTMQTTGIQTLIVADSKKRLSGQIIVSLVQDPKTGLPVLADSRLASEFPAF